MRYFMATLLFFSCTVVFSQKNVKEIINDRIPFSIEGKVIDAYKYEDESGENIYIITKKLDGEKTKIKGSKFQKTNSNWISKWEINDQGYEILLHFPYTRIIDIDKDGLAETIFCYEIDQVSWKIMLHYKDKKFAVRSNIPQLDGDKYTCKYDEGFKNIPPIVFNYVKKYWQEIIDKENLKTD
jgi:hypothetical protein